DNQMVFSAIKKSQTDLYRFTFKGKRLYNITDDVWDDLDPTYVTGGSKRGILFLSNRPQPFMDAPASLNQLPNTALNVFFYNTHSNSNALIQCSQVSKGKITDAIQYGADNFAYLYDRHGIRNKYVVLFGRDVNNRDSAYSVPVTNYYRNIQSQQYNPASQQIAEVVRADKNYLVYFKTIDIPALGTPPVHIPDVPLYEEPKAPSEVMEEENAKTNGQNQQINSSNTNLF